MVLHHTPESSGVEGKEKWREDMFVKVVEPLKYCHDRLMTIGGKNTSKTLRGGDFDFAAVCLAK